MTLRPIGLVLIGVLSSLLVAEGVARLLLSFPPVFERIRGYDESSRRLAFVARHSGAAPMSHTFDVYDSLRGWALAPGLDSVPVYGDKVLSSNSRGIRGRTEYAYARSRGTGRIVTLGDSFTFGEEVSDDETWSSLLAGLLPRTEVVNLGVHGYGHDQMLLYYRTEGVKYHPDVVVLGYVRVDLERNRRRFTDYAKPRFVSTPGGLRLENVPVPPPETVLAAEWFRPKLVDLMAMVGARVHERLVDEWARARPLAWAILDELVSEVRRSGAVPVFVYLPAREELADRREERSSDERALEGYCRSRTVDCLFLRPRFREAMKRGAVFPTTHHWGGNGHRLVAEGVGEFLRRRRLVPAESPAGTRQ